MLSVFLGGTVGTTTWRQDVVIPGLLQRGVSLDQITNPQRAEIVADPATKALVELHKANATLYLHTIALPYPGRAALTQISPLALTEAICGLYDDPTRTIVMLDVVSVTTITRRELAISAADLHQRFPNAPIFDSYSKLLDYLATRLVSREQK